MRSAPLLRSVAVSVVVVFFSLGAGCTILIDDQLSGLRDAGVVGTDAQPDVDAASDDAGPADAGVDAPMPPTCADVTCDANERCEIIAEVPTCVCDDGWVDDGAGTCVDVDECADGTLVCDASAVCRNAEGSAACVCLPGTTGDGTTCTAATVLIWSDEFDGSAAVAAGVTAAGFTVIDVHDDTAFVTAFDAGGFDLVIVATSTNTPLAPATSRVRTWIEGGGKAIIAVWNLDADADLRTAAQVTTTSFSTPRPIHVDPNVRPNIFAQQGRLATPIVSTSPVGDDGDVVMPTAFPAPILARFDTAAGPPAIVVTRGGNVIVNGFVPAGIAADTDGDGLTDFGELIQNETNYLLRPRILMYLDDFEAVPALPGAIARLGWTRLEVRTPSIFPTAYDAGGFDLLAIQSGSNVLDDSFQTRLFDWVDGGGFAVFSYWDLDGSNGSTAAFRNALQVSTVTRDTATPVLRDPDPAVDLFRFREQLPDTLTPTTDLTDNGDELTPTEADGVVVARFVTADGPGAIAVTRGGHVVVNGFLPVDFAGTDGDTDTIPDIEELYINELLYLHVR